MVTHVTSILVIVTMDVIQDTPTVNAGKVCVLKFSIPYTFKLTWMYIYEMSVNYLKTLNEFKGNLSNVYFIEYSLC